MASSFQTIALLAATFAIGAHAHGWVTMPVSKNELAFRLKESFPQGGSFRYEPQSSASGNLLGETSSAPGSSCGAKEALYEEGPATWQQWYDSSSGLAMPTLTPGSELVVSAAITADHGGQAWMMVACGNSINENVAWTYLERSPGDRQHHFMPSNPSIYAWATGETKETGGVATAKFMVPADLSCPDGQAVGRWLWKTANTCIDANSVGRKTETFSVDEYKTLAPSGHGVCASPPEIFISCFDFVVPSFGPAPAPMPGSQAPTAAPTATFLAPTAAPTPAASSTATTTAAATTLSSSTLQTTTSSAQGSGDCLATPGLNRGVSDSACAKCSTGYQWWPCNEAILCTGDCSP